MMASQETSPFDDLYSIDDHGEIKHHSTTKVRDFAPTPPPIHLETVEEVDEPARSDESDADTTNTDAVAQCGLKRRRSTPVFPTVSEILAGYNAVKRNSSLDLPSAPQTPPLRLAPQVPPRTIRRPPIPTPVVPPRPSRRRKSQTKDARTPTGPSFSEGLDEDETLASVVRRLRSQRNAATAKEVPDSPSRAPPPPPAISSPSDPLSTVTPSQDINQPIYIAIIPLIDKGTQTSRVSVRHSLKDRLKKIVMGGSEKHETGIQAPIILAAASFVTISNELDSPAVKSFRPSTWQSMDSRDAPLIRNLGKPDTREVTPYMKTRVVEYYAPGGQQNLNVIVPEGRLYR